MQIPRNKVLTAQSLINNNNSLRVNSNISEIFMNKFSVIKKNNKHFSLRATVKNLSKTKILNNKTVNLKILYNRDQLNQ